MVPLAVTVVESSPAIFIFVAWKKKKRCSFLDAEHRFQTGRDNTSPFDVLYLLIDGYRWAILEPQGQTRHGEGSEKGLLLGGSSRLELVGSWLLTGNSYDWGILPWRQTEGTDAKESCRYTGMQLPKSDPTWIVSALVSLLSLVCFNSVLYSLPRLCLVDINKLARVCMSPYPPASLACYWVIPLRGWLQATTWEGSWILPKVMVATERCMSVGETVTSLAPQHDRDSNVRQSVV